MLTSGRAANRGVVMSDIGTDLVPIPGTDLVPDGWCERTVMPWADEQLEQATIANASAQVAGLLEAYKTLGADTLELTKARRYLEVRWGELLGSAERGVIDGRIKFHTWNLKRHSASRIVTASDSLQATAKLSST